MKPMRVSLLLWTIALALPSPGMAQWQFNGAPVCAAANGQINPVTVSDGAGGAFIAWEDYRSGGSEIYAQRVNAAGLALWGANGIAIATGFGYKQRVSIIVDGAGGVLITWDDFRSTSTYDIYAQRVSASGIPQWIPNGVAVCTAGSHQYNPTIISDSAGGAIITWHDLRNFSTTVSDIYAQRVSAAGVPQWTTDGVALCTATGGGKHFPKIVSDGAGGGIVTWQDGRSGTGTDIYAQRVSAAGVPQWTTNGVVLCNAGANQRDPTIVSDGVGGAIVTWWDYRPGGNADIYSQRVNASGLPLWTFNGVALCTAGNDQAVPVIVSDGAGGAIVTWHDYRSGTPDIYARRINASGAPQWTPDGVALCTAASTQGYPAIVPDGAGGAIVAWYDSRSGGFDTYAQRVNASGTTQWTADGVALCTAGNDQWYPSIASDGTGGAIVTWSDYRSGAGGTSWDIYSQRVGKDFGEWGHPEPWITSVRDIPGDQGGKVAVNWWASDLDRRPQREITRYSIWRAVDPVAFSARAGASAGPQLVDASAVGPDFQGGAIRHERIVTTDYYWEWVGNQDARYSTGSYSAPTRADSITGAPAVHCFQVLAHTGDPYVFYESNVMCGHSVDNLAPAAPLALTAHRLGSTVSLQWNRVRVPDLRNYTVYRKTSSGVTPIPANFLSDATDTVLIDANAPTSALYYIVTASDVHENQSTPSNEAAVGATTGVGSTPPVSALTVLQNHPNPFRGHTEFAVGLPAKADLRLDVFDAAGRRVRSMNVADVPAGWQTVSLAGDDDRGRPLSSGVYFCRVTAGGKTATRKMVIAR